MFQCSECDLSHTFRNIAHLLNHQLKACKANDNNSDYTLHRWKNVILKSWTSVEDGITKTHCYDYYRIEGKGKSGKSQLCMCVSRREKMK